MKTRAKRAGVSIASTGAKKTINEIKIKLPSLSVNEGTARAVCAAFWVPAPIV